MYQEFKSAADVIGHINNMPDMSTVPNHIGREDEAGRPKREVHFFSVSYRGVGTMWCVDVEKCADKADVISLKKIYGDKILVQTREQVEKAVAILSADLKQPFYRGAQLEAPRLSL